MIIGEEEEKVQLPARPAVSTTGAETRILDTDFPGRVSRHVADGNRPFLRLITGVAVEDAPVDEGKIIYFGNRD